MQLELTSGGEYTEAAAGIASEHLLSVDAGTFAGDMPSCALGWMEALAREGHVDVRVGVV